MTMESVLIAFSVNFNAKNVKFNQIYAHSVKVTE